MKLGDLSWKDVAQYLKKSDKLIIPVGTCEQHGHHLPLNTDILITEHFSDFLSGLTGVPVAPTVNYSVNASSDALYCGTNSLSEKTLSALLRDMVGWWKKQGFKRFYILSYHGEPSHVKVMSNLGADCHLFQLYRIDYSGILEKQDKVRHACEGETSLMLYLYPEKVRLNEIADCSITEEEYNAYVKKGKQFDISLFPGCQGYPSHATVKKGRLIAQKMELGILKWYQELEASHREAGIS